VTGDDLLSGPVGPDAYGQALARIARRAAAVSGAVGLYQFGGVGCPGISDLDLLCVVPDGLSGAPVRQLAAIAEPEPLATHGPFIVERSRLPDMALILPGIALRHCAGPDSLAQIVFPPPLSDEAARAVALADIVEVGCKRWASLTAAPGPQGPGPRRILLTLWALTHLMDSAKRAGLAPDPRQEQLRSDVAALRSEAAGGMAPAAFDLQDLARRGATLVEEMVARAALEAAAVERRRHPLPPAIHGGRSILLPAEDAQLAVERRCFRAGPWSRGFQVYRLPGAVYAHFARCSAPVGDGAPDFDHAVARRAGAIEAYRRFVLRSACIAAAMPPGLFVYSRYRATRVLDALLSRRLVGGDRMMRAMSAT